MIPKILHYVWFGPYEEMCKYVDNWNTILPDYELVRWTNDNPNLKGYVDEAVNLFGGMDTLTKKPMTYLSDIVRLLILRDHGGIYMDHDIIAVKDFSELLNSRKCVLTFQYDANDFDKMHFKEKNMTTAELITFGGGYKYHRYSNRTVNNCFIAVEPNNDLIKRAIQLTVENHFRPEDEQYVFSDWGVGPSVMTQLAVEAGLDPYKSLTVENDKLCIFERNIFHPVHGAQRHELGYEQYCNLVQKIVSEKTSYTVHFHEHFGVSMLMEKRLTLFPEWYKSFYENAQ